MRTYVAILGIIMGLNLSGDNIIIRCDDFVLTEEELTLVPKDIFPPEKVEEIEQSYALHVFREKHDRTPSTNDKAELDGILLDFRKSLLRIKTTDYITGKVVDQYYSDFITLEIEKKILEKRINDKYAIDSATALKNALDYVGAFGDETYGEKHQEAYDKFLKSISFPLATWKTFCDPKAESYRKRAYDDFKKRTSKTVTEDDKKEYFEKHLEGFVLKLESEVNEEVQEYLKRGVKDFHFEYLTLVRFFLKEARKLGMTVMDDRYGTLDEILLYGSENFPGGKQTGD